MANFHFKYCIISFCPNDIQHKKWMNLQHDNAFYENVQESHLHIVVSYQKNKQEKLSNTFIMDPGKTYCS